MFTVVYVSIINFERLCQAGMQFVTGRMFYLVVRSKEWEWLDSSITGMHSVDICL